MFTLRNWSTIGVTPYSAPEQGLCLLGKVYGNPKFPDGYTIQTSRIIDVEGRVVRTASGSLYLLDGDPDPGFAEYLQRAGKPLDLENPIKVRYV